MPARERTFENSPSLLGQKDSDPDSVRPGRQFSILPSGPWSGEVPVDKLEVVLFSVSQFKDSWIWAWDE